MNVTFMIGNGFDLHLGMKTKYTDMYSGYINSLSEESILVKFKKMLRDDSVKKYETWSDFEMAMAKNAGWFEQEEEFIKCIRDFKTFMAKYLEEEQEKFKKRLIAADARNLCNQEMIHSLEEFYKGQTPNVISDIDDLKGKEISIYGFIVFNYTTVLDQLITWYRQYYNGAIVNKIVHIHGDLEHDIVLGADNISQIGAVKYEITPRLKRAFIKPDFNAQFDKNRVKQAEKLIENSQVICIYGMSLGASDRTWIEKVKEWLLKNQDNHLIYYMYEERQYNSWTSDEKMDAEEDMKRILLDKLSFDDSEREKVFNQVHIPVGYDIFNFDTMIKNVGIPPKSMGPLRTVAGPFYLNT